MLMTLRHDFEFVYNLLSFAHASVNQLLDAARDGRADDMIELMNEGVDKDFQEGVRYVRKFNVSRAVCDDRQK